MTSISEIEISNERRVDLERRGYNVFLINTRGPLTAYIPESDLKNSLDKLRKIRSIEDVRVIHSSRDGFYNILYKFTGGR